MSSKQIELAKIKAQFYLVMFQATLTLHFQVCTVLEASMVNGVHTVQVGVCMGKSRAI